MCMCVFSLISLYNQTPESTLLPVLVYEIEKIKRQTDEHHTYKKAKERNEGLISN
jgi:hypothetical protein